MGQTPTERSLNPVFEARVIVNTATTRSVVGFTNLALGATIAADVNNSTNEIFFRKNAAGTAWESVTRGGGLETITPIPAATVNVLRVLRIEVNNLAGKVLFYIDGNLVATHITNLPLSGTRLGYWVGITSTVAAITTMDVDYIKFWSDDPDTISPVQNNTPVPVVTNYDTLK